MLRRSDDSQYTPLIPLIPLSFLALVLLVGLVPAGVQAADSEINFGGSLRYNYFVKSWDGQEANRDKGGDLALDTFRIEADGKYDDLFISAEYRFYNGYQMVHHGYVGWDYNEKSDVLLGVSQVPFGITPYASHNWFFDVGYYVGLEDDYDLGVQHRTRGDNWDLKLAFFKNSEGQGTGNSMSSARYSYDVVSEPMASGGGTYTRMNEETNQFNARYAYTMDNGDGGSTEIGLSGQYGMLYNHANGETGNHTAYAAHAVGNYGKWNIMASYMGYKYDAELAEDDPFGTAYTLYGAYDAPYWIASEGQIGLFNVAYASGWDFGPFESLTFYNDFSTLMKAEDGFEDTMQNVLGFSGAAGPLYCYFDFAMGKNHPWLGGAWTTGLAQGDPDADWEYRFNMNFGYYF